ncbi:MAG: hotdog family protein [Methylovulum sp.]|nr:hotdog family protein [Methylovulum sp.]
MTDFAIGELLPHDGKMVLLERVIAFDEDSMAAEVVVHADGLFGAAGTVPAWLGIEYMAQTVAAHSGMFCKIAGKPLNLGFLLGTRHYYCNVPSFADGTVLTVTVKRLIQDQGLGVFDCKITGDGVEVLAKLNVYQPDSKLNRVITN